MKSYILQIFLILAIVQLRFTTAQVCNVNNGYQINSITSSGSGSGSSGSSGDSSGSSSSDDDGSDDSSDDSSDDFGDDGSDDAGDDSFDDSGDDGSDDSGDGSSDSSGDGCNGDASCEELLGDSDMLSSGSLSAITADGFADQDAGNWGKRSTSSFSCTSSQTCFVYESVPLCINVKTGSFTDPTGGYGNLNDGSYTPGKNTSASTTATTGSSASGNSASSTRSASADAKEISSGSGRNFYIGLQPFLYQSNVCRGSENAVGPDRNK
ncbi:hypothetical protein NA57DRAFT_56155 [Rhizodiscina lignyota]|uniref:Uncharacterized protein n=1 Tax=Rhizodiscina lignyota TaxID=1504668 RepID=A0A9P4ICU5_9PEZI|nr:hypothetical protein NA57DRAFT_56155 [Rhizodiscina lignyota]